MPPAHDRSALANAAQWVSRIVTVSLEMVLPGIAGVLADEYLGTVILFTLIGFGLGMTAAGWHLMAITRPQKNSDARSVTDATDSETDN